MSVSSQGWQVRPVGYDGTASATALVRGVAGGYSTDCEGRRLNHDHDSNLGREALVSFPHDQ